VLESFLAGVELALRWETGLVMAAGLFLGIFVGALPGFTTLMAMAILLPLSFFVEPLIGIPFLIGVYKGGIFGGSIPAILLAIPGTGASVATVLDGAPLARKGQARKALDMALIASVFGDLSSDLVTILLIGPIALIALQFGPPELAAILLLSMVVIAATSSGAFVKGLLMMTLGLMFALVGLDPIGALSRFTFDIFALRAGIPLLPLLIGVYALSEILLAIEQRAAAEVRRTAGLAEGERLSFADLRRCFRTILRSTAIGTVIGMIPGVGQVVAAFTGWAAAKNASKHPERFGKGELEGVAAAEAANNAVNGPTLVPLLTLGIPGDNITAILLGAFIAQGLRPGPQLMSEQGPLVFAVLVAMLLANILFLVIGYLAIPLFAKVVTIRRSLLLPLTVVFAFVGVYVARSDPVDLYFLVFFGAFGYVARKLRFDVTPMVMAFILGTPLEVAFGQTLSLGRGDVLGYLLSERPIAVALLLSIPLVAWLLWRRSLRLRQAVEATAGRA
jgi:putative tricarboxylic transport membrane protein